MSQPASPDSDGLLENIADAMEGLNQLEAGLAKLQPTLTKLGITTKFNLAIDAIREKMQKVQRTSKDTASRLEQLQNLVRTSVLITSTLELDRVLEQVMDTVIDLTGAERAYLMLRDTKTGELTPRTARNWDRESIAEGDVMISKSVINMAIEKQEPVISTNAQLDNRFGSAESVLSYALRSVLCIPLIMRGTTVGVLYADNRMARNIFIESRIPLLAAFGTQAAVAIENARLFERAKADLEKARQEIHELRIQIDTSRVQQQVAEITNSDFFMQLEAIAEEARKKFRK
jgi:GAF domain-containing protein